MSVFYQNSKYIVGLFYTDFFSGRINIYNCENFSLNRTINAVLSNLNLFYDLVISFNFPSRYIRIFDMNSGFFVMYQNIEIFGERKSFISKR